MSITAENVADKYAALPPSPMTEKEMVKRKPSGKKVYKPHLSTKVRWKLEDTMDEAIAAQSHMQNILNWISEQRAFDSGDDKRRARLGDLDHEIAYLALNVTAMERHLNEAIAHTKDKAKATAESGKAR